MLFCTFQSGYDDRQFLEGRQPEGESIAIITEAWYNPYSDESEGFKEAFPNAYDMYIDFLRGQVNVQ